MGVVTEGILAMPYEMAMADELMRLQYYQTVREEITCLRARNEELERALRYCGEAIDTGRSEPLFVARDLIRNTLEDATLRALADRKEGDA